MMKRLREKNREKISCTRKKNAEKARISLYIPYACFVEIFRFAEKKVGEGGVEEGGGGDKTF